MKHHFSLSYIAPRLRMAACLITVFCSMVHADESSLKTASVNMTKLMQEYYKTKTLTQEIEVAKEVVVKELQKKQKIIVNLRSQLAEIKSEIENQSIGDDRRKKLFEEHQGKFQTQMKLEADHSELIGRRQRAFTEKYKVDMVNLSKEIHAIVKQHAKAEDYDMVFDKTADSSNGGLPVVMFSKDAVDITSLLLKEINKDQPAEKTTELKEEKPTEEAKIEGQK